MRILTGTIITAAIASAALVFAQEASNGEAGTQPAKGAGAVRAASISTAKGQLGDIVTREQLDELKLSRVVDPAPKNQPLLFLDSAVALHMNKTVFAENEPLKSWLVVRYDAAEARRAAARMVLGDPAFGTTSGFDNARVEIVKKGEEGAPGTVIGGSGTVGGNPPRLNIFMPPDSFWMSSGDLRSVIKGKLEPGKYVAKFWFDGLMAQREFEIKAGTIEVAKADAKKPAARRVLAEIYGGWQGQNNAGAIMRRKPVAANDDGAKNNAPANARKMKMAEAYPNPRGFTDFQTGLGFGVGVGKGAKWYGSVDAIPANDGVAEITTEFQPDKGQNGGDRLIVRVTPVGDTAKENWTINSYASISLLLEWTDGGAGRNVENPSYNYGQGHVPVQFDRTIEFTVDLNAQWRLNLSQMGMGQDVNKAGKITVLFASSPVRSTTVQHGNEQWQLQQMNQQAQNMRINNPGGGKVWQGILKGEAMVLPAEGAAGKKPVQAQEAIQLRAE